MKPAAKAPSTISKSDGGNSRQADEQIHRTDDHLRVGVSIDDDEPVRVAADALGDLRLAAAATAMARKAGG